MWLLATYAVKLPQPVLVKSESGETVVMMVNLKGWDAEVTLMPTDRLGRIKQPRDGHWYYPVTELEITVTRDGELGDEMVHEEAARALIERLLVFMQFKVWHSLFEAIEKYLQFFGPGHKDADRDEPGRIVKIEPQLQLVSGYEQQNMRDYMSEYFSEGLARALLRDAKKSIECNRFRRACLELTMACEAALGMRLESASLVKASMGSVFINQHSQEYEHIVHLFQARDAIKHGGGGLFKFVSAAKKQRIQQDLTHWQGAVECLASWLHALNKGLQEAR